MQKHLKEQGIPTAVHYPVPLHKQPALAQQDLRLPVSMQAAERVLNLPIHPYLLARDQNYIVETLKCAVAMYD